MRHLTLALLAGVAPPTFAAPPSGKEALPPRAVAASKPVARGYAPVNGLHLYYEVHGPDRGTPLVLLHGGDPAIETSWAKLLPLLARTRRVIAFDQAGHGRTADRDGPFSFEDSADDTAALLAWLEIPKADVMGFSNGANIALQVAVRHRAAVRRLVVVSGAVRRDGFQPGFLQGMQGAKLEGMPAAYAEVYRRTSPHPDRLGSYFRKSVDRVLAFPDWPDDLVRSIDAPTLVVAGDADVVLPGHAAELARLLPHGRLAILPLTDHGSLLFARAGWLQPMVEAFLDGDGR